MSDGGAARAAGHRHPATRIAFRFAFAYLINVVVLNFSYDVPVKLYSSHLLALALFLAAPEFRRLANVFLFNRTARGLGAAIPQSGRERAP